MSVVLSSSIFHKEEAEIREVNPIFSDAGKDKYSFNLYSKIYRDCYVSIENVFAAERADLIMDYGNFFKIYIFRFRKTWVFYIYFK